MSGDQTISLRGVSKFYGDVLGVNHVDLEVAPGLTALVGPNGSGKSTLMNLMTGLLRPSAGEIRLLGIAPSDPERLFSLLGYCPQFEELPRGLDAVQLIGGFLRLHGMGRREADSRAWASLDRVGLREAARRRVAGYSKGMRQRLKLAQAMAHEPRVLVLDEPLNGLDPMARAELIALFRELADEGRHVVVSSHILHEVDMIADQVVMVHQGYVVAEGEIPEVREEMVEHPMQIAVRCAAPATLAARLFEQDHVVAVRLAQDGGGLLVTTRSPDRFFTVLGGLAARGEVELDAVSPADDDVLAVYQYLIGGQGEEIR